MHDGLRKQNRLLAHDGNLQTFDKAFDLVKSVCKGEQSGSNRPADVASCDLGES